MTPSRGDDPVRARLERVSRALGPLAQRVVLIGGSIAPLLHTESLVRRPRPTDDVDRVIDAEHYVAQGALQNALRAVGFTEAVGAGELAHRWRTPDGDLIDLVPTGAQLGGWAVQARNGMSSRSVSSTCWRSPRGYRSATSARRFCWR